MTRRLTISFLALSVAGNALAQTSQADNRFTLGTVTVTAPRVEDFAPSPLVISDADIERLDLTRLSDVLATQPGLTLTPGARGSGRNEDRVYLRGFDGLQVPFLIDGIPFYISYDGEPTDLARFTTFDLAAVEVSKSYVPIAAGPGALGGAINLVTRRPSKAFEGNAGITYDADSDFGARGYHGYLNLGGRRGDWYAQLGLSRLKTDAWRLSDDFAPAGAPVTAPLPGNLQPAGERLRSQSEDSKISLRVGYTPNETDEYAFSFYDQQATKQVPPYAGPPDPNQRFNYFDWPQWDKRSFYFLSNTSFNERLWLRTRLYYDIFRNSLNAYDNIDYDSQNTSRAFTSDYDDHSVGGSVVLGLAMGPGELQFATHVREDYHKDVQAFPARVPPTLRFEDRTISLGAEYRWALAPAWSAVIGVSHDSRDAQQAQDQNAAGASFDLDEQSATNMQGALTWNISEGSQVHASIGHRSRFPSMFERYSYRLGSAIANPGLQLERSTNYEIGYSGTITGALRLTAAAFLSDLDDLIQPVTVSPGVTQNQNVGSARYSGAELGLKWSPLDVLDLDLNYTYLDRESTSTPRRILFGTPRNSAFAFATWRPVERLQIVPGIEYATDRRTSDVASARGEPVDGYTLFHLRAILTVFDHYSIELGARNLGDRDYQLDYGYPREGRSYSLTFRARY